MAQVSTETSSLSRAPVGDAGSATQITQAFSIPIVSRRWEDCETLNAELLDVIMSKSQSTRGVRISNVGGWHSEKDLQDWPYPCVTELVERIKQLAEDVVWKTVAGATEEHACGWDLWAWANINRRGDYNAAHTHHSRFVWSGVYYVDPGDSSPPSGLIKFEDRSGVPKEILNVPDPFEREIAVEPEPGLMLMFPVTLFHYVEPYLGDRPRVSIGFDLANPAFTIPFYDHIRPHWWVTTPWIRRRLGQIKSRLGIRKPLR